MGFKTVAISRGPEKKDFAEKLGAHVYIDSNAEDPAEALQKLGGAKVIAAVAPSGEAMEQLVGGLAVNGQLLTLAVADKLEVPIMTLIQKRASVRGWPSGSAADSEDTVKFAQTAGVECMIEEYPLDKVNEAFGAMMEGKARCVQLAFWSFHRWATQLTSPPAGSAPSLSSSRERSPSSYGTFAKSLEVVLLVHVRQISREGAGRPCFAERLQQTTLDKAVKVSFYTREGGDGERRICAPFCLGLEKLVGHADEVGFVVLARLVGKLVFAQRRVVPLDRLRCERRVSQAWARSKGRQGRTDFFRS
jgi:hypothetical protein